MADSDKNILITPNRGSTTADPNIVFTGGNNNSVTLTVLDDGTLSFSGSAGQLFSVSDSLSGTIFSVNDVSGIPSIEVDDTGEIRLAEFSGNVLIGTATDTGEKVQVNGTVKATAFSGNASSATQLATSRTFSIRDSNNGYNTMASAGFNGTANVTLDVAFPSGGGADHVWYNQGGTIPTSGSWYITNYSPDQYNAFNIEVGSNNITLYTGDRYAINTNAGESKVFYLYVYNEFESNLTVNFAAQWDANGVWVDDNVESPAQGEQVCYAFIVHDFSTPPYSMYNKYWQVVQVGKWTIN